MLLACLDMSGPGIFQIPFRIVPWPSVLLGGGPFGRFGFDLPLLYGCVIADTIRNRRVHPAFIIGAVPLILIDTPIFSAARDGALSARIGSWLVSLVT